MVLMQVPVPPPVEGLDGPNFGVALAALIVSLLALGIGGYSLVWQIVRHYRWARPRLTVTGDWGRAWDQHSDGTVDSDTWTLEVEVTNTGDVGTQIIDVYWEFPGERGPLRVSGSGDPGRLSMEMDWRGATEQGVLTLPCRSAWSRSRGSTGSSTSRPVPGASPRWTSTSEGERP